MATDQLLPSRVIGQACASFADRTTSSVSDVTTVVCGVCQPTCSSSYGGVTGVSIRCIIVSTKVS